MRILVLKRLCCKSNAAEEVVLQEYRSLGGSPKGVKLTW